MMDDQLKEEQNELAELLADNAGAGFEGMEGNDFAPPFVSILQAKSPQVEPGKAEYMPEARQGMIYSSVSRRLYDKISVVPVGFTFRIIEWKPNQGGFVKAWTRSNPPDPSDIKADPTNGRTYSIKTGNQLSPTAYYLCMLRDEGNEKIIIPMASSQLKKSRKWNSLMQSLKVPGHPELVAPMYAYEWVLSTEVETKNNNTWFGWRIGAATPVQDVPLIRAAKQIAQLDFLPDRELQALSNLSKGEEEVI